MIAVLSDMPMTSRARRALVLAALVAVPAAAAGAQGSVPGALAKRAAQNAVAATNAHTEAMTSPAAVAAASAPANTPASAKTVAAKAGATKAGAAKPGAAATTTPAKGAAATTPAAGANPAAPAYAARSKAGTPPGGGTTTVSVTERNAEGTLTFQRETFEYSGRGRRDPFVSLIKSGELRPLFSDLKLVTVLYDPTGRNSVAIMHDVSTKDQYRVKVGQTLGRMRVSQIQPKQVVFAIEEFGYGRQAVLALNDSTKARKQ